MMERAVSKDKRSPQYHSSLNYTYFSTEATDDDGPNEDSKAKRQDQGDSGEYTYYRTDPDDPPTQA